MKQLNWRRPLALAALLLVLWLFTYWLESVHKPKQAEQAEEAKKILNFKDVPVATIRVVDGAKVFAFHCLDDAKDTKLCKPGDNSKWEATEPQKFRADDSNVNMLLSSLNNVAATETISLGEETPEKRAALLQEYKLGAEARHAAGARRIEVVTVKGERQTLFLGETHPIGDNVFAVRAAGPEKGELKADETKVYLVPVYFKNNIDHDLTYWRDKKLFTLASHEISGVAMKNAKGEFSAERKDGQWLIQAKIKGKTEEFPGDIEGFDNLLSAATYLSAKTFVSEKKTDPAARSALRGTKPVLTLSLRADKPETKVKNEPIVLTLFEKTQLKPAAAKPDASKDKGKKAAPEKTTLVYATLSTTDPLYELESSVRTRLEKSVNDLRMAKLLTSMERYTAKRLEFTGGSLATPLVLVNADSKWQTQPDKKEARAERVQDLLDKLSGGRIKEFLQGKDIPAGEQSGLRLTLGDEKNEKSRQFVFWKNGDKLYARDLQIKRPEAYLVDNTIKDVLPWNRDLLFAPPAAPSPGPSFAPVKIRPKK